MRKVIERIHSVCSPGLLRVIACLLVIGAAPSYYLCWDHYCMGGHMEHPPYPTSEHVNDWFWIVGYGLALGMILVSDMAGRILVAAGIAYLFGAKAGLGEKAYESLLLLVILCALAAMGIAGLILPKRLRTKLVSELLTSLCLALISWATCWVLTAQEPSTWQNIHEGATEVQAKRLLGTPHDEARRAKTQGISWRVNGIVDRIELSLSLNDSNRVVSGYIFRCLKGTEYGRFRKVKLNSQ